VCERERERERARERERGRERERERAREPRLLHTTWILMPIDVCVCVCLCVCVCVCVFWHATTMTYNLDLRAYRHGTSSICLYPHRPLIHVFTYEYVTSPTSHLTNEGTIHITIDSCRQGSIAPIAFECQLILICHLNLLGLFSTERGTRDLEN